ncbi:MAG: hypothetical protein RLY20_2029 [Verrucomicrobiota bacterium]
MNDHYSAMTSLIDALKTERVRSEEICLMHEDVADLDYYVVIRRSHT